MIYDKIISDKDCNTIVVNEEFLYPYVYVYILQLNRADGTTQNQTIIREFVEQKIRFDGIRQDGFYTLCKLRIKRNDLDKERFLDFKTLQEQYDEMTLLEQEDFIANGIAYYENDKFYYKEPNKTLEEVREATIEELVQLNPKKTKIDITYYYYFQVCKLRACYAALAQKVLDERQGIRCNISGVNKEDIYRRDLVWSALNTILYMAEQEQFEEAERLLESIVGCNGLCDDEYSNCGCR